jgi:hypothetical protein
MGEPLRAGTVNSGTPCQKKLKARIRRLEEELKVGEHSHVHELSLFYETFNDFIHVPGEDVDLTGEQLICLRLGSYLFLI